MNRFFYLPLIPLFAVAAHAEGPTPEAARLAAVEESDRAFLSQLERQAVPAPAPATASRAVTVIEPSGPADPAVAASPKPRVKTATASARPRTAPVRRAPVVRDSEPVYRGIPVEPEFFRMERRSIPVFRTIEIRRPVIVRKVTTTTVTTRPHRADRDEDEDDD